MCDCARTVREQLTPVCYRNKRPVTTANTLYSSHRLISKYPETSTSHPSLTNLCTRPPVRRPSYTPSSPLICLSFTWTYPIPFFSASKSMSSYRFPFNPANSDILKSNSSLTLHWTFSVHFGRIKADIQFCFICRLALYELLPFQHFSVS